MYLTRSNIINIGKMYLTRSKIIHIGKMYLTRSKIIHIRKMYLTRSNILDIGKMYLSRSKIIHIGKMYLSRSNILEKCIWPDQTYWTLEKCIYLIGGKSRGKVNKFLLFFSCKKRRWNCRIARKGLLLIAWRCLMFYVFTAILFTIFAAENLISRSLKGPKLKHTARPDPFSCINSLGARFCLTPRPRAFFRRLYRTWFKYTGPDLSIPDLI